jgi:anti-sigma factor RsiW
MKTATIHDELSRMVSAYLDGELTQAESQRVRIHIEDCGECARAYAEMTRLRNLTAEVMFPEPPEDQWEEVSAQLSVSAPRQTGWLLIIAGLVFWVGYLAVTAWRNLRWPEPEEAIAGAVIVGFALLAISVVRQRWIEYPRDRYRRVKK